ncbi:hypothetical protein Q7P37_010807 [Cladosporium fusiforme]
MVPQSKRKQKQTQSTAVEYDSPILLHQSLSHSAFYLQITGSYWKIYLPNGQRLPNEVSLVRGWIESIQTLEQQLEVVHKAFLALSLAFLGRINLQEWMTKEGQRLYGDALTHTLGMIEKHKKNQSFGNRSLELITTVRLLSFFEAVQLKNDADRKAQANGWMIHNIGEASLLLSNPPSFYASGPAYRLFVDGRMNLAAAAMWTRKASFLNQHSWKTLPWTLNEKTPRDLLVDIAFEIPSLYERIDHLPSFTGALLDARMQEVIITCLDLHRQLEEWKAAYYAPYEKDAYLALTGNLTTRAMSARTMMAAPMATLFCAYSLKVYSTLHGINPTDDWLPARSLADKCCRDIVRVIPVLLTPAMGMFRVHVATFPLGAAVMHVATMRSEDLQGERIALATYLALPVCRSMRQLITSLQPSNADYVLSCGTDLLEV